jgi:hypothetical protein
MAKNSSDQFSKQLLEEVLSPFGTVETSYEVSGELQWADVYLGREALKKRPFLRFWRLNQRIQGDQIY